MRQTGLLTEAQKHRYEIQSPVCPWCGCDKLDVGNLQQSDYKLRCLVTCLLCRAQWFEVYRREGIEDLITLKLFKE